jgi:hypothetical protein
MLATVYPALFHHDSHHLLINYYALPFMSFMMSNQALNGIKNYIIDIVLNQHQYI